VDGDRRVQPTSPDGIWALDQLPPNVRLGRLSVVSGARAFARFFAENDAGLTIGDRSTIDGSQFAVGPAGRLTIGSDCYFSAAVLLCEQEIRIGDAVMVGWNATIADCDFHPLPPEMRRLDAVACSPLGDRPARPPVATLPVIIEDDAWIGPNATVLQGVRIGAAAFLEPGSVVTRDVPPRTRVLGNPARVVGEIR
jgi:acetyltransferase-like isoleucine patch superfamily enzyme